MLIREWRSSHDIRGSDLQFNRSLRPNDPGHL